jgi:hypothetical protein
VIAGGKMTILAAIRREERKLESQPFRELCAARKRGEFRHEKYHKRLENIADNAGGQVTVAQVAPPTGLTEIQQKRTCLQIPAQSLI